MAFVFPILCLILAGFHVWYAVHIDGAPEFTSTTYWLIGLFGVPLLGSAFAAVGARSDSEKVMPWFSLTLTAVASYAMYPIKDFAGALLYLASLIMSYVVFFRAGLILARFDGKVGVKSRVEAERNGEPN
jgi:hypothetical protein